MSQEFSRLTSPKEKLQEELVFMDRGIRNTILYTLTGAAFTAYMGYKVHASFYIGTIVILKHGVSKLKEQWNERENFLEMTGLNTPWEG